MFYSFKKNKNKTKPKQNKNKISLCCQGGLKLLGSNHLPDSASQVPVHPAPILWLFKLCKNRLNF